MRIQWEIEAFAFSGVVPSCKKIHFIRTKLYRTSTRRGTEVPLVMLPPGIARRRYKVTSDDLIKFCRSGMKMVEMTGTADASLRLNESLQNRLREAFRPNETKVIQFPPLANAFNNKLAVHPFLIAPSCTFRKFHKYENGKQAANSTSSLLPWRMLSIRDIADNIINSMPSASVIDPLLLDDLQEPEFYRWISAFARHYYVTYNNSCHRPRLTPFFRTVSRAFRNSSVKS